MINPDAPKQKTSTAAITRDSLMVTAREMLRTCKSREQLLKALFDLCVKQFSPLVARLDYKVRGKLTTEVANDPRLNDPIAQRFNSEYLEPVGISMYAAKAPKPTTRAYDSMEPKLAMVCAPVVNLKSGETDAVISAMVSNSRGQAGQILARLDALTALVSAVADSPTGLARIDNEARAIHNLADVESPKQFAYSLVNSLCNRSRSELVSFGIVRGKRIEVLAVSGITQFKHSSPGIAVQRQAMEECLDAGKTILHQNNSLSEVYPIHRQWAAESNGCLLSIPINSGDNTTGVVCLRRPASSPFTEEEINALIEIAQPYGSAVRLVDRATQSLSRQMRTAVGQSAKRNRTPLRLLMWAGLIAAGYWFATGSMMFKPICSSVVASAEVRHFSAPFQARLKKVHVEPGASVKEGQLLAEFETREMRLEFAAIQAEIGETEVNMREALQQGNASQAGLQKAHIDVLRTRASALEERIARATILAPQDGNVVMGDLTRRLGDIFQQGEEVLQFTPNTGWVLEIRIPDSVASHIVPGQSGEFSSAARSNESIQFEIQSVDGAAQVVEEQNVFIARAPLNKNPKWMRSGMEGFAQVKTQEQPAWWVLCHGAIDWARMNFWL